MKKLALQLRLLLNYETLYALILAALIFSYQLNTVLLIVFVASVVFTNLDGIRPDLFKDRLIFLSLLYFLVIGLSALHSDDVMSGLKFLERNLAFLFVPFSLALLYSGGKNLDLKKMLRVYMVILTILACIALLTAIYKNHVFNIAEGHPFYRMKSWFFTYHYLAGNVNCTAIYLSLYTSFSFILLTLDILGFYRLFSYLSAYKKIVWEIFLFLFLVLLSARTILAITIVISISLFAISAYRRSRFFVFLSILIVLSIPVYYFVKSNDVLRLRLLAIFKPKEDTLYFSGSLSSRLQQWKAIVTEVLNSNPFFGTGVGDLNDTYLFIYEKYNLPWAIENGFNAHNMYVEIFLYSGLLGLLVFIVYSAFLLLKAFQYKSLAFFLFTTIFLCAGITESLMNRQYGIIFFVMFSTIFYYHKKASFETSDIGH